MKTYLLLLGIACAPAIVSWTIVYPLWFIRRLSNDQIRRVCSSVLIIALISCYIPVFLDETLELGYLFIPLSLLNFPLLRLGTRLLCTTRCPECRSLSLRITGRNDKRYYLLCRRCGTETTWRPWSLVPDSEA